MTEEMPKHVCAFGLVAALPRVYAMWERFHEDLDPNDLLFKISHCPDVGCRRGGWGEMVMKVYAEEVPKEQRESSRVSRNNATKLLIETEQDVWREGLFAYYELGNRTTRTYEIETKVGA